MDPQQNVELNKALQILEIFRSVDSEMTTGTAVTFLMIALGETKDAGITITEISKAGEFSLASASRYVQALAKLNRHRRAGYELVSDSTDLMDRRKKVLKTTVAGKRLASKIVLTLR